MLLVIILCLLGESIAQEPSITIPPQPTNISLIGVAEFNCTARFTNAIVWMEGNKTQIDSANITEVHSNSDSTSIIRISGDSIENGSNITCTAVSLSPLSTDESQPAQLLIQGLLETVKNFAMNLINPTTVLISWSPPFTLEGVPILGYNVTFTNAENESTSEWVDTGQLFYTPNNLEDIFIITVVAFNEVGAGKTFEFFNINTNIIHTSHYPSLTSQAMLSAAHFTTTQAILYPTTPQTILLSTTTQLLTFTNGSISATISPSSSERITEGLGFVVACVISSVFLFLAIILTCFCMVLCGLIRNKHKRILHLSSIPPTCTI